MVNGAALYEVVEKHYRLYLGGDVVAGTIRFETFPHAVACALSKKIVSAKQKRNVRRELLRGAGIDTNSLNNIDTIDAALCALASDRFLIGDAKLYGEAVESGVAHNPSLLSTAYEALSTLNFVLRTSCE